MLISLQIKDFLLIEQLELDFFNGLTVITGETGSGKSITIDALMIIFGTKTGVDSIRHGQSQSSFTAVFQINNPLILTWLKDRDMTHNEKEISSAKEPNILICRRVIDCNGRSKSYVNGLPVNLSVIKELGEMLLDIHTQHASIALLKPDNQRILLDEYAGVSRKVMQLGEKYKQISSLQQQLAEANQFRQDALLKQELLEEKIAEISGLNLGETEWQALQVQHKQLANSEFLLQELDFAQNIVGGEQNSLADISRTLSSRLTKISGYFPDYSQVEQLLYGIETEINELDHELQSIANKIEQNPELLREVETRIEEIYSLARKYRIQPENILSSLAQWRHELAMLTTTNNIETIQKELNTYKQEYLQQARVISELRRSAAGDLSIKVTKLLHQLAISGEFKVNVLATTDNGNAFGLDNIQYVVCFNQGMQVQPLNKVISGGELSRVALALYVTLSLNNPPELIVFDEIDVGIGGGVAEIVGTLLKELGKFKQVICITHQPQTACCGDYHLQVSKQVSNDFSYSTVNYIEHHQRLEEIARMLGGLNITETTRKHAKEMLKL